ncbi:acyl- N-acyltransferase [Lentinula edodes]|uniref:Acyl-N-acyltransferase n=1 Tax=Lentinula edodes TaxID=5353 RepID=A0A1Q3E7V9_LENED|nr:acyl- N-acyltransferase [Lentinula edodes]
MRELLKTKRSKREDSEPARPIFNMSVLRSFKASDMFKFNNVNLDIWTETEAPSGRMMGYGKAEGQGSEWHGHVTAITVAPEYRRLSLARKMMSLLELVSDETYRGFFVDLYVRCNNFVAIDMYEGMGYRKGGRDEEDAFDMRKPLSRDSARRSVRSNGRDIVVSAHDVS